MNLCVDFTSNGSSCIYCLQDPSSPLLHSEEAFRVYISCLVHTGQHSSVSAAVRRRESLLAANPLPESPAPRTPESAESTSLLEEESTISAEKAATAATAAKTLSSSQEIAQNVMSGTNDPIQQRPTKDATLLTTPLSLGSGSAAASGTPIEVTIVERS